MAFHVTPHALFSRAAPDEMRAEFIERRYLPAELFDDGLEGAPAMPPSLPPISPDMIPIFCV